METLISDRLTQQMAFLVEVEKLKAVYRQNMVTDLSRHENSAEHSWHVALMAMVLTDSATDPEVDPIKAMKMLILHDIVEIDAGDVSLYDVQGNIGKEEREDQAAERIFGLLPPDQKNEFTALWKEFDERETPTALFAAALDNMQPVVNHYTSGGYGIKNRALKTRQIIEKKQFIAQASPELWSYTHKTILQSEEAGFYSPE